MSQYTTGEVAKRCGVSVRTVQYYDTRGILTPSALSEGGRRLYSGDDLSRMKVICFLRELSLPLDAIGQLLSEEDPGSVIDLLIEQQAGVLRGELEERRQKLEKLEALRRELRSTQIRTVESIGDIAKKLKVSRRTLETKANLVLGTTLKTEINRIRLNEAVRLISNTDLSIQEVAERCGFCCASHLNSRFKSAFGHSPSVFRYRDP